MIQISSDKRIGGFSKIEPIYHFNKPTRSEYNEKFWSKFWDIKGNDYASHYPFKFRLEGKIERSINWSNQIQLSKYWSKIKSRLFPYGAVSFHFSEYFKFNEKISSDQIIEFLSFPIMWDGDSYTTKQFWSKLRNLVVKEVLNKNQNYPSEDSKPYHLIHPEFEENTIVVEGNIHQELYLDENWNEIAKLLAVSSKPVHTTNYLKENFQNLSDFPQQRIFSSPYATVLLTPDSDFPAPYHGKRCLRNRLSNIIELVLIQDTFARQYQNIIHRMTEKIRTLKGHKGSEIKNYLWGGMDKDEFVALKKIFSFHEYISNNLWKNWYKIIGSGKAQRFSDLKNSLDDLNKANLELGEDARNSISGFVKFVGEIVEPVTELAGLFGNSDEKNGKAQNEEGE